MIPRAAARTAARVTAAVSKQGPSEPPVLGARTVGRAGQPSLGSPAWTPARCLAPAKALSPAAPNAGCARRPQQAAPAARQPLAPPEPGWCPLLLLTALGWSGGHSLGDGTQQCPSPGSPARDCLPSSRHQTGTSGTQPSIQPAPQTRVPPEAGKANPRRSPRPASRGLCFASRACRHSRNAAATKPTRSSGTKIPLRGLSRVNAPSAPASVPSRQAGKT